VLEKRDTAGVHWPSNEWVITFGTIVIHMVKQLCLMHQWCMLHQLNSPNILLCSLRPHSSHLCSSRLSYIIHYHPRLNHSIILCSEILALYASVEENRW